MSVLFVFTIQLPLYLAVAYLSVYFSYKFYKDNCVIFTGEIITDIFLNRMSVLSLKQIIKLKEKHTITHLYALAAIAHTCE